MARKSTKKEDLKVEAPVVETTEKIEEAKNEYKQWYFQITDADGFAFIRIMDHRGVYAPKGLEVADGIIQHTEGKHFVFAGSKREAAARLSAVGFIEII